jgi:hypothetical protein
MACFFHNVASTNELSACLAADRRVAGREELERHRSERAAAGRKATEGLLVRDTVAPHQFKFLANFRNCFDAQQKSHRAMPPAARCRKL